MYWDVWTKLTPLVIQLHWATAALAFFLGLFIILRPKGTAVHRTVGVVYSLSMLITSVAAFFVRHGEVSGWEYLSLKGMSWIHLFVPLTLFGIISGVLLITIGRNPQAHRRAMVSTFMGGLIIAGGFTFIEGRRMNLLFFGPEDKVESLVERANSK
jgi:uncharacterized membrane protein